MSIQVIYYSIVLNTHNENLGAAWVYIESVFEKSREENRPMYISKQLTICSITLGCWNIFLNSSRLFEVDTCAHPSMTRTRSWKSVDRFSRSGVCVMLVEIARTSELWTEAG